MAAGPARLLWSFLFICSFGNFVKGTCPSSSNWFAPPGNDCVYRCHCKQWNTCDQVRGECSSAGCANEYAGTACQYDNLAFDRHIEAKFTIDETANVPKAVDGDPATCFLEQGHSNLPLEIHISEQSWVDVITVLLFRNTTSGQVADGTSLKVTYFNGNVSQTLQPHLTRTDDRLVTYHLPQPARVTRVQIRAVGDRSLALCEVSVLSGRNLALKKNASQGEATYSQRGGTRYDADRAVDGNTETNFSRGGSCSHTDNEVGGDKKRSWWTVFLGHNLNIWRFKVYNRQDYEPERLSGFRVNVTLSNSSKLQVYTHDGRRAPLRITDIILPQPLPATRLTVWHVHKGKFLILCEVEVFGDCQDGYFGWECDSQCRCQNPTEICDKIWGFCRQSGCRAGYRGDGCQQECRSATYGFQCAKNCSAFCANGACDHVTGNCTSGCLPGWEDRLCDQKCPSGYYGDGCSAECPPGCQESECDHVTGVCSQGCQPGWSGHLCNQTCDEGFYGNNCSLNCSSTCLNNSCDASSGHCLAGCTEGMTGNLCDKKSTDADKRIGTMNMAPVVGGIIAGVFLLLAAVVIVVILKRRGASKQNLGAGSPHSKPDYENSDAILMDPLDAGSDGESHGSQSMEPRKEDRTEKAVEDKPDGCIENSRSPQTETAQHQQQSGNASPSSKARGAPTPKPRKAKPELMSLFSRDANQDPSLGELDPTKLSPLTAEKAPPPCFPKEGPKSSSCQSSPRSQRSMPTQAQRVASFESLEALSVDDLDIAQPGTPPRTRRRTGDSDYYNIVCRETSPNTAIPLAELPTRVAQWLENPRHFNKERSTLPVGKVSEWKTAMLPENMKKNRYKDIYPYDQTRVVLTPLPGDPHSDFYNACHIDGYNTEKEYIAAQGPMERTLGDFLRLLWDLKCSRVVMLTNTVELGRFKCQQYWPEAEEELTSGDITVILTTTTYFADYCIRHLTFKRNGGKRSVVMYHYTAWPDNFAPSSPWSLMDFRQKIRQGATEEGPVLVHCSAGIGRTGTYLALDILLSRAQQESDVDVFTCVWKLRQQRINMVQTLAQYIFIHETLLASVLTSPPVPVKGFNSDRLFRGDHGTRLLDTEYSQLQMCLGPAKGDGKEDTTPPEMFGIPRDIHRVNIWSTDGSSAPVYINAIFLSSYTQPCAYIQTHSPAELGGAADFLSMVVQHDVTTIVCLDSNPIGTTCYWPDTKDTEVQFCPYKVTLLSMRKERCMTVRRLRVTLSGQPDLDGQTGSEDPEESKEVTHFTCSAWPQSRLTPSSVSVLLDLVNAAVTESESPVLVHCRDGHTRSGLFCVTAAMVERMRVEDHVAVNYVTAHMRVPRRENIVNLEQYEFLYACAQHQINVERGTNVNTDSLGLDSTAPEENTYGNVDSVLGNAAADRADPSELENLYGNLDTALPSTAPDLDDSTEAENTYGNIDTFSTTETTKPAGDSSKPGDVESFTTDENVYGNISTAGGVTQQIAGDGSPGNPRAQSAARDSVHAELDQEETENIYSNS